MGSTSPQKIGFKIDTPRAIFVIKKGVAPKPVEIKLTSTGTLPIILNVGKLPDFFKVDLQPNFELAPGIPVNVQIACSRKTQPEENEVEHIEFRFHRSTETDVKPQKVDGKILGQTKLFEVLMCPPSD